MMTSKEVPKKFPKQMISLQELRNKFFFVPAYILASKDAHDGKLFLGEGGDAG